MRLLVCLQLFVPHTLHAGHIQAILIATPKLQWVEPFGTFEGPFTSGLFCKVNLVALALQLTCCCSRAQNACQKDQDACSKFKNSNMWSTSHWEFADPAQATCEAAVCKL